MVTVKMRAQSKKELEAAFQEYRMNYPKMGYGTTIKTLQKITDDLWELVIVRSESCD